MRPVFDPDRWLAYLYAPILPYLKKIRITRSGSRGHDPQDILVPAGYVAEIVATGFNAPVHCTFDNRGFCYITEAGHKIDTKPRILKVDVTTGQTESFFDLPANRWIKTSALTGCCWHQNHLYVTNTNTLFRLRPDGSIEDLVTDLPGLGDHQTNYPVVGPDGKIYFGQGSATNAGVVGADNFAYEWLPHFPEMHDVPAQDVTLVGRNYEFGNVLGAVTETARSDLAHRGKAGWPPAREGQGHRGLIGVVGVPSHQGERESRAQGAGAPVSGAARKGGVRDARRPTLPICLPTGLGGAGTGERCARQRACTIRGGAAR